MFFCASAGDPTAGLPPEYGLTRRSLRLRGENYATMTSSAALAFIRRHGVVLEAGRGPVPNLAEAVAGAPIRGSWWGHAKGREIFHLTRAVRDSADVLVCRLVGGKITYVHRRLWPAVVRLASRFARDDLAALREVHTVQGRHAVRTMPFPRWVPSEVRRQARGLSEIEASAALGEWGRRGGSRRTPRTKRLKLANATK